jgi:hypothetical protein
MRRLGWEVRHLPAMTILHHAGKAGSNETLVAQDAYSRQQYMIKHMSPSRRRLALAAYALGHVLRLGYLSSDLERRACSRRAVRTLLRRVPPPFEQVRAAND